MAYFATPKTSVTTVVAASATKVPATAQASRLLLKLYNDDTANPIWYGDSSVDNTKGIEVAANGESAWIPCSGDIYVYSVGGTTVHSFEGA